MKLQLIITNSRRVHRRQRWGILAEYTSPPHLPKELPRSAEQKLPLGSNRVYEFNKLFNSHILKDFNLISNIR